MSAWIPVNDRLPEKGKQVLIYYEYYDYFDKCTSKVYGVDYVDGGFFNWHGCWPTRGRAHVIAWTELPELPNEDDTQINDARWIPPLEWFKDAEG